MAPEPTVRATRYEVSCLPPDGEWDYEPMSSSREDDWLDTHRFDLDEALELAKTAAPLVTVNGLTVADVLAKGGQP